MQNAARSDMPASVIRLGALIRQHSDRFYEIFKEWDINKDGKISKQEFAKSVAKIGFDADKETVDTP